MKKNKELKGKGRKGTVGRFKGGGGGIGVGESEVGFNSRWGVSRRSSSL